MIGRGGDSNKGQHPDEQLPGRSVIKLWGTTGKDRKMILTGPEGGGDAGSHHRSKQHVEGQDVLRVVGHVLQLVLGGAGVQGQLPGTVPAHKLCGQTQSLVTRGVTLVW